MTRLVKINAALGSSHPAVALLAPALILAVAMAHVAAPSASAQVYVAPGAVMPPPPKDSTLTIRVRPLAPGVFAAKVNHVWTGWVELDNGLLVVDAAMADSAAAALADTIRARSPKKAFRYLVLTHDHEDHIRGARRFLDAGAALVAHEGALATIDSLLGRSAAPGDVGIAKSRRFGGAARPVDVVWLGKAAHSAGDLIVHLPKQKVIFSGDLVWNRSVPWLLDPHMSLPGWRSALDSLQTKRFAADMLVPGHGDPAPPLQAITFTLAYLRDVEEKATRVAAWGTAVSTVRDWGYLGAYEGLEFYDEIHFMNMRRLYNEAKGMKTPGRNRVGTVRK